MNDMNDDINNGGEGEMRRRIEEYRQEFHMENRRRIRSGIKCLLIIPLIFLVLLLMTGSDRIIFLSLWVISMFLIAVYLIYAEYMDFKVDKTVAHITGQSFEELHAMTAADARDISASDDKENKRKNDEKKRAAEADKTCETHETEDNSDEEHS